VDPSHGAFAEYCITTPPRIWKINKEMNMIDASGFIISYGTAYMAMIQRAKIHQKPNQSILVTAASGGLGTACIQLAKAFKCKTIIGCFGFDDKKKNCI